MPCVWRQLHPANQTLRRWLFRAVGRGAAQDRPDLCDLDRLATLCRKVTEGERAPSDDLALQFEAVQQLSDEERAVIREVVESLIIKYQSRRWDSARPAAPAAKKAAARRSTGASR